MPRTRTLAPWLPTTATALLIALWLLSLPFYAGSSLGPYFSWRLEHARLKLQWSPFTHHESFFVDANAEGLRWTPDSHFYAINNWFITVPLWIPLALAAPATVVLWYRRSRAYAGHCKRCGYDRRGLPPGAACPECGSGKPPRRS
jgi:hypothetical protein